MGVTRDKFVFRQKEQHVFTHTLIIVVIKKRGGIAYGRDSRCVLRKTLKVV